VHVPGARVRCGVCSKLCFVAVDEVKKIQSLLFS
jgi:hypothetical protein